MPSPCEIEPSANRSRRILMRVLGGTSILKSAILTLCLAGTPLACAQDLAIDDFSTGRSPILAYNSGNLHTVTQTGAPNHLIGGTRSTNFNIASNPLKQYSTFQFRPDVNNA